MSYTLGKKSYSVSPAHDPYNPPLSHAESRRDDFYAHLNMCVGSLLQEAAGVCVYTYILCFQSLTRDTPKAFRPSCRNQRTVCSLTCETSSSKPMKFVLVFLCAVAIVGKSKNRGKIVRTVLKVSGFSFRVLT